MTDASALLESIKKVSSRVDDDMSEQDVENAFLNEGFFRTLGYEGAGVDLRSEFTLGRQKYTSAHRNGKAAITAPTEYTTRDFESWYLKLSTE